MTRFDDPTIERLRAMHAQGRDILGRIPWWNLKLRRYLRYKLRCLSAIIDQREQ